MPTSAAVPAAAGPPAGELYYRHALPVRIMHWVNAVALAVLLMSGLQIFNAHPALYWGKSSYNGVPPLLVMQAAQNPDGTLKGETYIFGRAFDTTGVFGASKDRDGEPTARGFPWWLTIPDNPWLSMARLWHFFFAWIFVINGIAYVGYGIASRHLARDLAPTGRDWRSIGRSVADHLRLRHAKGEAAKRYNILQKLAYLVVIFVLLPLIILMGLAMSPWMNSVLPGWIDLFGGRQSARTIHFVAAWLLVGFVLVHVFEAIIGGAWNNLRSMLTGRYRVEPEKSHD